MTKENKGGRPPGEKRPLEDFLLDALRESCGRAGLVKVEGATIPLVLKAVARGGDEWSIEADPPLRAQVEAAVQEAAAKGEAFRPGRIYCYRCESSACGHGAPPLPGQVFTGYSSTGLPLWQDLVPFLVERRHPKADLLCNSAPPVAAAFYVDARSLTSRQLGVFGRGSKTYDILGQVVFGFLRFPPRDGRERERTALTIQAVEVRGKQGRPQVVLNVLGRLGDGSEAVETLEGPLQMRVLDALSTARRQLRRLRPGGSAERDKGGVTARTATVLRRTAAALEQLGRQSLRRTRHAEKRVSQRRPTAKALEEALGAGREKLFWDDRAETVVVIGTHGRVHVFSSTGKHVTSLALRGEEIDRRVKRKRWRALGEERRLRFQEALQKGVREG